MTNLTVRQVVADYPKDQQGSIQNVVNDYDGEDPSGAVYDSVAEDLFMVLPLDWDAACDLAQKIVWQCRLDWG